VTADAVTGYIGDAMAALYDKGARKCGWPGGREQEHAGVAMLNFGIVLSQVCPRQRAWSLRDPRIQQKQHLWVLPGEQALAWHAHHIPCHMHACQARARTPVIEKRARVHCMRRMPPSRG
jgi:hypothetical protein